jgi:5-formyltetrahydrofolate cyclo-ligase
LEDARAAKRRLRAEMAGRRKSLSPEARADAGRAVARFVRALPEYARAARIAAYAAIPDELPLDELLGHVIAAGRTLLLPRIEDGALVFAAARLDDLRTGAFGIAEPMGPSIALTPDDLVLVPGVAFDASGGRLGRGAGFYDRALSAYPAAPACFGVGFAFQLVARVPTEPHDRRVDGVVTELGVVRAAHDPSDLSG